MREVIGRRLDRLSERCNQTLTVAAVIGREFGLRELSRLIDDLPDNGLLEVLEEALAARVIEELPAAVGAYQFTHALIQEVVANELSTTRRVRLHARIADALEELYGEESGAHAAQLARHYAEAVTVLGPEKLVRYSLLAGQHALASHAYEEASAQFARALAAKEGRPTDAETAELLFGLARAEFAGHEQTELREALGHLRQAFDHYATVGDAQRAASVAAHPIPPMYGQTGVPELMSEALALARANSPDEGRLLSTLGWFSGINEADYQRSREAFDRSLTIARTIGDPALETRALVGAAAVDGFHLQWQSCLEESARALELALAAGDERSEMIARGWALRVSAFTGDLAGGRAHAAAAISLAEKLRERYWLATAHVHNQWLAVLAGDVQAARASSDAGLLLQPLDGRNLGSRALLEYQLGQFTDGDANLDRLFEAADSPDPEGGEAILAAVIPAVWRISGDTTRRDTALDAARNLLSSPTVAPIFAQYARIGLALDAVQRNDADEAREKYAALESQRDTAFAVAVGIAADRLLGLLAATLGELDLALRHYESARLFCDRAGYRPEYAWTASDYAEALLDSHGPGDHEKALALQDEALSITRELRMTPLTERILSRRDILKA